MHGVSLTSHGTNTHQTGFCQNYRWETVTAVGVLAVALTVTGGLTYHFSLLPNAVSHSLIATGGVIALGDAVAALILWMNSPLSPQGNTPIQRTTPRQPPKTQRKDPIPTNINSQPTNNQDVPTQPMSLTTNQNPQATKNREKNSLNTIDEVLLDLGNDERCYIDKVRQLSDKTYLLAEQALLMDLALPQKPNEKLLQAFWSDKRADCTQILHFLYTFECKEHLISLALESTKNYDALVNFLLKKISPEIAKEESAMKHLLVPIVVAYYSDLVGVQNSSVGTTLSLIIDQLVFSSTRIALFPFLSVLCRHSSWVEKKNPIYEYYKKNLTLFDRAISWDPFIFAGFKKCYLMDPPCAFEDAEHSLALCKKLREKETVPSEELEKAERRAFWNTMEQITKED